MSTLRYLNPETGQCGHCGTLLTLGQHYYAAGRGEVLYGGAPARKRLSYGLLRAMLRRAVQEGERKERPTHEVVEFVMNLMLDDVEL